MDAAFHLFKALVMAPDNRALAVILPAMLSEDYLNANNTGMAEVLINLSVAGARRFPGAISDLGGGDELRFQLEVQRIFLIGHEMGHLLLAHSTPSQRERTAIMQTRLDHAIRFASNSLTEPVPEAWMLRGSDERFRDELFCDTVATEMVEVALMQPREKPSECQRLAFEAIYFSAFALDLMRTLKRAADIMVDSLDVMLNDALFGRPFIRSVSLNLLAQSRFQVTKPVVDSLLKRVERALRSEFGLLHVLSVADDQRKRISSDAQYGDRKKARLDSLLHRRPDPTALFQDRIY